MSGQWEVVGKNKKNGQNGKVKAAKEEKLPQQQPKPASESIDSKEAKTKPPKESKPTENKKSNPKKQNERKPQEQSKSKIPKTIDTALKQEHYFSNAGAKAATLFPELLKRLPTSNTKSSISSDVIASFLECFKKDKSSLVAWKQSYGKHTKQSVYLLNNIKNNWKDYKNILPSSTLRETLNDFQKHNNEVLSKSKKKDESLVESNKVCQDILDKMSRSRGFPWFWASFLLFSTIIGLLAYDANQKGSFEKSVTGKFLKDMGAYETTQQVWFQSLGASARGYVWLEKNTPYYYSNAVEFSKPYAALTYDLGLVGTKALKQMYSNVKEYAVEKTPLITNTIDQYAPGLIENVQGYSSKAWTTVCDFTVYYYNASVHFLGTKVFIDEWAPEVLKTKTLQALNTTQIYAAQYYNWFHKQVELYSKVK